jgi:hypothetical protein
MPMVFCVQFNSRTHSVRVLRTAYDDLVFYSNDAMCMLLEINKPSASAMFSDLAARISKLKHQDQDIGTHIEVLNGVSVCILLSYVVITRFLYSGAGPSNVLQVW